jgi:hypothetical protein
MNVRALLFGMLLMLGLGAAIPGSAQSHRMVAVRGSTMIVLTAEVGISLRDCRPANGRVALKIDVAGRVRTGCWHMLDKHVEVDWGAAERSLYHQCEFARPRASSCVLPGKEG